MRKIIVLTSILALSATSHTFAQKTKVKTKNGEVKIKSDNDKGAVSQMSAPAAATGFSRTESGLEYKMIKDVPGSNSPKLGDNVEMHIVTRIKDSILFDSRKMNNNQPVPFQIMAPSFRGDIVEGFMMMTPGDSALFRISVDSLKKAGMQMQPWMQDGDKIEYEVALVSVKSQEEMKKEQASKSAAQIGIDEKILQDYFKQNNIKPLKTVSGLYYAINTKGTGAMPASGQYVTVNYTGRTIDGKVFDSNVDPAFNHVQPFTFQIGQKQVIAGWDEGVALLNKGSKGSLYIPSVLAYGERGAGGAIPPNAVLIFDVEVTDISSSPPPQK